MYWVYVLDCNRFKEYIGQSKQIYKRHDQHRQGNGANFTATHEPLNTIVLYKVKYNLMYKEYSNLLQSYKSRTQIKKQHFKNSTLYNFFRKFDHDEYLKDDFELRNEAEDFENEITIIRNLISPYSDQKSIRGGKWHQDMEYPELAEECKNFEFKRPMCKCGQYTEIEYYYDFLYFVCPFKNYFVRKECNKRRYCNFKLRITKDNNYHEHKWDEHGYISSWVDEESEEELSSDNDNPLLDCLTDDD